MLNNWFNNPEVVPKSRRSAENELANLEKYGLKRSWGLNFFLAFFSILLGVGLLIFSSYHKGGWLFILIGLGRLVFSFFYRGHLGRAYRHDSQGEEIKNRVTYLRGYIKGLDEK